MKAWEALYGPNLGYVLELYERYQQDPLSVDAETRAFFKQATAQGEGSTILETLARPATGMAANGNDRKGGVAPPLVHGKTAIVEASAKPSTLTDEGVGVIVRAARLARSIREYGHLAATVDALGRPGPGDPMLDPATHRLTDEALASLPGTIVFPTAGPEAGTCLDAVRRLCEVYCGSIGYEFDHVQNYRERVWLHEVVEDGTYRTTPTAEQRRGLLRRLTEVEGFERFLHRTFVGQKRFSIEGNDALVPMLDELIQQAVRAGTHEIPIGMAHRGRLNVLAHVLEKPYATIFSEFQPVATREQVPAGSGTSNQGWTGDVKYHLGARRLICDGDSARVQVTMADNPSHLEFVNPVVEGFARAAQDVRDRRGAPGQNVDAALAVTIHGDAAFPGEGVVAETLNLSRVPGYQTGGTIRIIVNNQIGFTTGARAGRSTLYASDLAKGFEIPIVHVNADDPEACLATIRLAHAYRDRFNKDFLIDLVGYRRWGHNEGDEPAFTQPRLYARINAHPTVRERYAQRLIEAGVISAEEADAMMAQVQEQLQEARAEAEGQASLLEMEIDEGARSVNVSRISAEDLREMNEALLFRPPGFSPPSKLERLLERRREALDKPGGIDWALAETLAFAAILEDGTPIRLTGQDSERGTFSQRHLVLHDARTGDEYIPLQALPQARASFAVYNSPLTESAVIGFEYGYSVHAPDALVLWEAQYGDFANVGQVLIDQFIAASRAKWRRQPGLVMLLPHGYEGQGPEHSSARIERFLQLAAEDNLWIVNCTSAAQYFHVLRAQAASLSGHRRPLVVMTPKSLLRHPLAGSSLDDLVGGTFRPVVDDAGAQSRRDKVERLILCSGKVAIDLTTTARQRPEPVERVAVVRIEQLYPFPGEQILQILRHYPEVCEVTWLQEEPQNMGAWAYIAPHLREILPEKVQLEYLGRPERASTAEGSPGAHAREQSRIVDAAFEGERQAAIETHGVHDVS